MRVFLIMPTDNIELEVLQVVISSMGHVEQVSSK
jgi:hypothetical protein